MAVPPDFVSGQVLTAAQMNQIGLWEIKSQTVGTAVSTVVVTGAFSQDFENYLITYNGGVASSAQSLTLQLGSTTTGYYTFGFYGAYNAATIIGFNASNTASWGGMGRGSTNSNDLSVQLFSPNLAKNTHVKAQGSQSTTTGIALWTQGYLADTTQYTSFTLGIEGVGSTMTGGVIRVYGMRN